MDHDQANRLLTEERRRTQELLAELARNKQADRTAANEPGDMFDSAEPLTGETADDSVAAQLQRHLAAIDRAEKRLRAGTYGYSVRTGRPIPDERLESDPTAELTAEEATGDAAGEGTTL
jgi:DnaK suppressor protein